MMDDGRKENDRKGVRRERAYKEWEDEYSDRISTPFRRVDLDLEWMPVDCGDGRSTCSIGSGVDG